MEGNNANRHGANNMTYEIHGIKVNVTVSQGVMSDVARGNCVGKVVNLCRAMTKEAFSAAVSDKYSAADLAMHNQLDAELATGYTKRRSDDFAPIANVVTV